MSRTRTIEIDYDELPRIRHRELAVVRGQDSDDDQAPRRSRDRQYDKDYRRSNRSTDERHVRRRGHDQDYAAAKETTVVPYNTSQDVAPYERDERRNDSRRSRQREARYDDRRRRNDSDSDESSRSRRRRRRRAERLQEQNGGKEAGDLNGDGDVDSADEAIMWYSGEKRSKANFAQRHFDSSYEGITAAVAGGLIGGMTARRFGGEEHNKAKVLAATFLGAASFNGAENWYRCYTEERAERKEQRKEGRQQRSREKNQR